MIDTFSVFYNRLICNGLLMMLFVIAIGEINYKISETVFLYDL